MQPLELSEVARGIRPSGIGRLLARVPERQAKGLKVVKFGGGYPPDDLFDSLAAPSVLNHTTEIMADPELRHIALQYGSGAGVGLLQEAIAEQVSKKAETTIDPQQVIITLGLQEGIRRLGQVLLNPGDVVFTDTTPYSGAIDALHQVNGVELWGLPTDQDGIIPGAVQDALQLARREGRKVKMLSVLNVGNPDTGVILSPQRGQELTEIAERNGLAIFQDDAYSDIVFDGTPAPPLQKYGRAIYGGTASKSIAPGLRVGWIVVPLELKQPILGLKTPDNLCTPPFNQLIVARYILSGEHEHNMPIIRDDYRRRRDTMEKALTGRTGLIWQRSRGGMFNFVRDARGLDTQQVADKVLERSGVLYLPGTSCLPDRLVAGANIPNNQSLMRLNYTGEKESEIGPGIIALDEALEEIANDLKKER